MAIPLNLNENTTYKAAYFVYCQEVSKLILSPTLIEKPGVTFRINGPSHLQKGLKFCNEKFSKLTNKKKIVNYNHINELFQ